MYRNRYKGDDYIKAFPELKKWINECICCHRKGYAPDMPEHVGGKYSIAAQEIKTLYEPLNVDKDSLCEVCSKLVNS